MSKKQQNSDPLAGSDAPGKASRRTPLWAAFAMPVVAILIFLALLEGSLALFGVRPALQTEDPFVGFASNAPLFVASQGVNGEQVMMTAPNKKDYFNRQTFARQKGPDTFRIFTLGGSTTYGRPYDDSTSFSGWLRELLPAADKSKKWEVINAGGISYASYRVAKLMEELIQYQPDLFIIYTGHNEFLEERTYRKLRNLPPLVQSTASVLSKTRTWSALTRVFKGLEFSSQGKNKDRYELGSEVDTILDRSVGLNAYKRDDVLQKNVIEHFQISLEHMVVLARSVGARVIFVKPASNLKDCSPFKSQHTPGITTTAIQRSEQLEAMSQPFFWGENWGMALNFLDQAVKLDPRSADLQYLRGQALLGLGRYSEAQSALRAARDEDICPLRALTPLSLMVVKVAKEQQVPLVDFEGLLEQRMLKTQGYPILGKEYFLDHVHPTIEGHKLLAIALLETMANQGMTHPATNWRKDVLAGVSAKIENGVNQAKQGQALANLARVLLWARKDDDAARLAKQALDVGGAYKEVAVNAGTTLVTAYARNGKYNLAVKMLYSYLEKAPNAIELRLKLGQILLDHGKREEAAANFLLVSQQMPYYDWAHALFGIAMAERGRPRIAYSSLMEALRINPNNDAASRKLELIRPSIAGMKLDVQPPIIHLDHYPSSAPHTLIQGRLDGNGNFIPDGIEAEFYESGRLKSFIDLEHGKAISQEMKWDENGEPLTR